MALNAFGGLRYMVGCLRAVSSDRCPPRWRISCGVPPRHSMKRSAGARHGNTHECMLRAERIATLDERYSAFVTEWRMRAKDYRTKAIVQFVERHLEGEHAS